MICLDLEGVLVPEIWIGVAERSGIDALQLTTRDEPDYDVLMRGRLRILAEHGLGIGDIYAVIDTLDPLPGAREFLDALRERYQVAILSDTFYQFAAPLMRKLAWPSLYCNSLEVDADGRVSGYRLRQPEQKRAAVRAFRSLEYSVIAAGDSYNDIGMLREADAGILFRAPENVIREHPEFPVVESYAELLGEIDRASGVLVRS